MENVQLVKFASIPLVCYINIAGTGQAASSPRCLVIPMTMKRTPVQTHNTQSLEQILQW